MNGFQDLYGDWRVGFGRGRWLRDGQAAVADGGDEAAGVGFESFAAVECEGEAGDGFAGAEVFFDGDHAGGLEAAGVGGEVAVGQASGLAELDEFLRLLDGKGGEDAEPARVGYDRVERHVGIIGRPCHHA